MAISSSPNRIDCVKIYYVDDDIDDIETFEFAVSSLNSTTRHNIELLAYQDGDLFLRNARFDETMLQLVFLDVNMPAKSGFEILREIKQNPVTEKFPVIIFSTSSNRSSIDTSRLLGASNYITKPNNFSDLNMLILKAIDNHTSGAGEGDFLIS